jgi:hypothetical protein
MDSETQFPTSLTVVAVLFLIGGILSALDIVFSLFHGRIEFNPGVLGLFIGPGLFRLRRGWRTCGLVLLWLNLVFAPIFAVLLLAANRPLPLNLFGIPAGEVPIAFGLIFVIACFALALWSYFVLTRADVRALFGIGPPSW